MASMVGKLRNATRSFLSYFSPKSSEGVYFEPANLCLPQFQQGDLLSSPVEHALWGKSVIILDIFESYDVFNNRWEYLVLLDDGTTHIIIEGALDGWVLQQSTKKQSN